MTAVGSYKQDEMFKILIKSDRGSRKVVDISILTRVNKKQKNKLKTTNTTGKRNKTCYI